MSRLTGHSDIDAVRSATDLVRLIGEHVVLRPKGREHVGLCPFHDDKNPSFCVVTHKGNAFYKCHSCGAGGDAYDFVMNYHRMEFGEALRFLADRAGITLQPRQIAGRAGASSETGSSKRTDLRKANGFAATFFRRVLQDPSAGAAAREVIAKRGISDEMVEAFMLGAAPDQWDSLHQLIRRRDLSETLFADAGLLKKRKEGDGFYDAFRNRLIFPICDDLGNPIAFGARKINPDDEPKYLNSAESPLFNKSRTLYGLHRAKRAIIETRQVIVTEGYTDVIACHQAGICNVVGTLGTALTRDHARVLSRLCDTVVLVFDGDEAGQKAADRGLEVFFAEPVDIRVCVLPDECDPDELLKQEGGREAFQAALARSTDALAYKIERFRSQVEGVSGLSGRQKRLESFLADLAQLGFGSMQGVRKRLVLAQLADLFGLPVAEIEAAMPKPRRAAGAASATEAESAGSGRAMFAEPDGVAPARRRAEEQLLAILVYQPELHSRPIVFADGKEHAVTSVFKPDDFADSATRTVAESVFSRLVRGIEFTVQELLSDLGVSEARNLASSLYFQGQKLCETDPLQQLQSAAQSLRAHIALSEYQEKVVQYRQCAEAPAKAQALLSVIEQRRRQGLIPAAIGRVRS